MSSQFYELMTSQFYAQGVVLLGSTDAVDQAVADGAVARMEANNAIFRWPDGREVYHAVPVGSRGNVAKWINRYNERVGVARRHQRWRRSTQTE
jgi:hypothetical protein